MSKNRQKILFIARRFPPSVGGMERFAFDLSNALKKEVNFIKITWGGSNKWLPIVLPWFFLRAFWQLAIHRDISIIHMQDAVQAPIGWLLHIIFRKPYIIVAHGLDITYQNRFYQAAILPFVRRADAIISISTATNEEAIKRGVPKEKTHVITLGTHDDYGTVNPNKQQLAADLGIELDKKILLLTTGRLVKRKGVEWFIEHVLTKLVKSNKNILYLVAGDGAERDNIETAIARNKLEKNVLMLGRVPDEVRSLLYQSSDIFVMPNIVVPGDMEGFGIVVHEAATAELPVVASNLEGIADALQNEKNGILVETRNIDAFVSEIQKLAKDEALRKKFGKKARVFTLREYSWQKIADQYIDIYQRLEK